MITTLTGSNRFLISQELTKTTNDFVAKYGPLAVERIDGEEAEYERINEALTNLPFLVEKKLVILRDPSKNAKFRDKIEQIIGSIPASTDVLISESKIDKRQSYFKTLKSKTDFKELNELDNPALASWLVKMAEASSGKLSLDDANYLINRVGSNQQLLSNELKKLLDYDKNINKESIDLLTEASPQSSIFDLLDAAFSGHKQRVLKLYDEQRRQNVEPLEIMAMLAWQLRILAIIKAAGQKSPSEISSEAKLNPFVVRKSSPVAAKISVSQLKKLVSDALKLDVRLKSESINADDALKYYLLAINS